MGTDLWAVVTSTAGMSFLGAVIVAVLSYYASRTNARDQSMATAFKMGDDLRDELRETVKDLRSELQAERAASHQLYVRVNELSGQLSAAQARIRELERLRCDKADCPVFKEMRMVER